MATTAAPATLPHTKTASPYDENSGIWSWLTTVDHKRIGVLYLFTALSFLHHRRARGGDHPRAASGPQRSGRIGRDLQSALHDARHDDDLPRGHAAVGCVFQLPDSAPDRRTRRGVPPPQRVQLLGVSVRRNLHHGADLLQRRTRMAAGSVTLRSRPGRSRPASTSTSG